MKKILGLDLGTTSIGWALVNEAEDKNEKSEIIKLGVRVNPLTTDEIKDFTKGNSLSVNAERTLARGARRNLQRFKLRRSNLINILTEHHFIETDSILTENGTNTTHQTLKLRALASKEKIEKQEFARVLLAINKKRGYKSSRKAKNEEEGTLIDGMGVAKELYDNNLTPGEFVQQLLTNGKKYIPDFYRSDLKNEFLKIWNNNKKYYPTLLTDELFEELANKNKTQTWAICAKYFNIQGITQKGSASEKKLEKYTWRAEALNNKLDLEKLTIVLQEINNDLNKSSGYLGDISDRSKVLYFNKITVGQYLYSQIEKNRHTSLKKQVFYRQDYLDEFEKIWETQAKYYPELTDKLKEEIRDVTIFYQRKLKSQKGLISICQFENKTISIDVAGTIKKKVIGPRVAPKSSPIFQEFKIWQVLNNLEFSSKIKTEEKFELSLEDKQILFNELNLRGELKDSQILKLFNLKTKDWKCNYDKVEGNNTNKAIFNVLQHISNAEGYGFDWNKKNADEIINELQNTLPIIGIDPSILTFNCNSKNLKTEKQYQLWHLLYATEDDVKVSKQDIDTYGINAISLKKKLHQKFGVPIQYTGLFANIHLQNDYGNLSNKAIRKILPYLQQGHDFSEAAKLAGYNHSNSLTKEENLKRVLKEKLEIVAKNSLRNPVVEKILNQMVNVVNLIIDTYGKPDEVRIELARELKKSAKERKLMTSGIAAATKRNENIKKLLQKAPFSILNPTKNDILKYRLYKELEPLGYKTIYTNKYISPQQLFSKEIDIEHIIPKAKLFDDSFSNKTLAFRDINLEKSDTTAFDFIKDKYNAELENYTNRVKTLYNNGKTDFSKAKYLKLLMEETNLPEGFIERDLRNSQYIAKKAKNMLLEVVRNVHATTGSITDKLRNDWDLINVMKELNLPKYRALGLTTIELRKNGNKVEQINDWTKRNDHRHHAMDALTVAFTTHSHIQYINNLNARSNKNSEIYAIQQKITFKNSNNKRVFKAPITNFRTEAKKQLEAILISIKAKNKVVTKNINTIKTGKGLLKKEQLTPRGQLHKETVYAKKQTEIVKQEKINSSFTIDKINTVTKQEYRTALLERLADNNNDPKKAFAGKNALTKNKILLANGKEMPVTVTTKTFETIYTIRKEINPDNFKDVKSLQKITDAKIKKLLTERLASFNGDAKKAFTDLKANPIWLNQQQGIALKRVTITGVANAEALHDKKDQNGKLLLDDNGNTQATDFVSTGNNHHVAIYKDAKGNLQEQVVSLFDATARAVLNIPVVDKNYNKELGWEFIFTLKQNELFIFPTPEFNPNDIDLLDEKNYPLISPHLFRVQKISTKNYFFRHHLETTVTNDLSFTYKNLRNCNALEPLVKVRTNHLGQIVQVGEY